MAKRGTLIAILATAGLSSATAAASDDAPNLGQLAKLEGRWRVEEVYPGGEKGRGDVTFKLSLDDTCLIADYKSKCKEIGSDVKGHSVFKYVPQSDTYQYWWFDNYGNAYKLEGTHITTNDSIVLTRDSAENEKMRYTFRFKDENTVVFTMEFGNAKEYDLALTATYDRRGRRGDDDEEDARPKLGIQRGIR